MKQETVGGISRVTANPTLSRGKPLNWLSSLSMLSCCLFETQFHWPRAHNSSLGVGMTGVHDHAHGHAYGHAHGHPHNSLSASAAAPLCRKDFQMIGDCWGRGEIDFVVQNKQEKKESLSCRVLFPVTQKPGPGHDSHAVTWLVRDWHSNLGRQGLMQQPTFNLMLRGKKKSKLFNGTKHRIRKDIERHFWPAHISDKPK